MKMESKQVTPMRLAVTEIKINKSTGTAAARIPGPPPKSALDQPSALVLQAVFAISASEMMPGFQLWYHVPGSTVLNPLFVHVSIMREETEGEQAQLAEIDWPPQRECHETFAVAIAHMLPYVNQTIRRFI